MAVAVVVGSAVLGGFFGGRVLAGQDRLDEQYEAVRATALAAVETTYVGEVDSEQLVYRATAGMLQRLDPHSNFMDPALLCAPPRAAGGGGTTAWASPSTSSTATSR